MPKFWGYKISSFELYYIDLMSPLPAPLGIDYQARGAALARRLLRPAALLCAIALYRFLYCLGTLHRQLQHDALEPSAFGRRRYAVPLRSGTAALISAFLTAASRFRCHADSPPPLK